MPTGPTSAALRLAVVGPIHPGAGPLAAHTVRLAQQLTDAGHDVTLVSWSPEPSEQVTQGAGPAPFPRTVRSLARNRPDTWVRTGRRLRAYDTVVLVHTGAEAVLLHLALLRAAGVARDGGSADPAHATTAPRAVLVADEVLPAHSGVSHRTLVATLMRTVDGVLLHRVDQAEVAVALGAPRVYAVADPGPVTVPADAIADAADPFALAHDDPDLSAPWAAYLGAVEALAAPPVTATDPTHHPSGYGVEDASPRGRVSGAVRAVAEAGRAADVAARAVVAARRRVELSRADLPDWLLATDVLDDGWRAEEARDEARRLGLPRSRDAVSAWAALGALAAVVRVADDGRHAAVVVDESGASSPLSRWLRACGFAPVDLGLTTEEAGYDVLEVDAASLDVVARVHPGGCDAADVDEAVAQAAWALRPGGLLVLTLPLGRPGPDGALGPADVRAVVARAHDHGFVLVGDLDGEVGRSMRSASRTADATSARVAGAAYGLVRLTLRRR